MQLSIASGFCCLVALLVLCFEPSRAYAASPSAPPPKADSNSSTDPRAAQAALERARQLQRTGATAEAIGVLERAIVQFPRDVQLRFMRAVIHVDAGEQGPAVKLLEQLTQDFPELPEPYNNLAVIQAQQGNYEAAKRTLEEAIRVLPSYNLAHQNLGEIYLHLAAKAFDNATKITVSTAGISRPGQPAPPAAVKPEAALKRLELVRELLKKLEQQP
jgi:tetratricopeptide (TPR) repeat protein